MSRITDGSLTFVYQVCLVDTFTNSQLRSAQLNIENLNDPSNGTVALVSTNDGCVSWTFKVLVGERSASIFPVSRRSRARVNVGFVLNPSKWATGNDVVESILIDR